MTKELRPCTLAGSFTQSEGLSPVLTASIKGKFVFGFGDTSNSGVSPGSSQGSSVVVGSYWDKPSERQGP